MGGSPLHLVHRPCVQERALFRSDAARVESQRERRAPTTRRARSVVVR
jgi:hypothetical protein